MFCLLAGIIAGFVAVLVVPVNSQLGQDVHKWTFLEPNMSNPVFDADGLSLSMVYPISDYITSDMVKYELYNRNCSEGKVRTDQYFNSSLVHPTPGDPQGDGSDLQLMNITIFVDPASFNEAPPDVSDQWYDSSKGVSAGRVQFCIKAFLHLPGNVQAVVDGSETLVIVDYDLTDGFEIEVSVGAVQNEAQAEDGKYQYDDFTFFLVLTST
jgi:hypothetical protein